MEGEAGLGKTRLLEEFKGSDMAGLRGSVNQPDLLILSAKGDAAHSGQVHVPSSFILQVASVPPYCRADTHCISQFAYIKSAILLLNYHCFFHPAPRVSTESQSSWNTVTSADNHEHCLAHVANLPACNYLLWLPSSQALHPWRPIFQRMFVHDRAISIQRAAAVTGSRFDLHVHGTSLGRCLKESGIGLYDWKGTIATTLELSEAELPVLPADFSTIFTSKASSQSWQDLNPPCHEQAK